MKRVFITTSWEKLIVEVFPYCPSFQKITMGIESLNEKGKLFFDKVNNQFNDSDKESDLILIHDEKYSKEIESFEIIQSSDFLLHHSRPRNPVPEYSLKFKHFVQGEHGINGKFYIDVFDTIFNEDILDKSSRLIDLIGFSDESISEFEELESKLEFLHSCLMPNDLSNAIELIKKSWGVNKEFEGLNKLMELGPFNKDFSDVLSQIREKLLN